MSRRPTFSDFQVKEMKESVRTGEPVMMLAEKFAAKYNVLESSVRSKLYYIAKHTYKIAEWNGPKRRTRKPAKIQQIQYPDNILPPGRSLKRVTLEEDHIRIYF